MADHMVVKTSHTVTKSREVARDRWTEIRDLVMGAGSHRGIDADDDVDELGVVEKSRARLPFLGED